MIFDTATVEDILKYKFKDKLLLRQCFTHSTYSYENKTSKSNEVLEFFGDAIIEFVVTEYLFKNVSGDEGVLSQKRASMVSRKPLQDVVFELGIEKYMLLGGGLSIKENSNEKMYSSLFEAIVAGIYIDGGINPAKKFIMDNLIKTDKNSVKEKNLKKHDSSIVKPIKEIKKFNNQIKKPEKNNSKPLNESKAFNQNKYVNENNNSKSEEKNADYKSEFQELVQKYKLGSIEYQLIDKKGPDHAPNFKVSVFVEKEKMAEGEGPSKKIAETQAAGVALYKLKSKLEKKEIFSKNDNKTDTNLISNKSYNKTDKPIKNNKITDNSQKIVKKEKRSSFPINLGNINNQNKNQ